jgi:hypothetical protein
MIRLRLLYITFILIAVFHQKAASQNEVFEYYLLKAALNNTHTSVLSDGFYVVKPVYRYDTKYKVSRTQHTDTIILEKKFLFFKKKIKAFHVYSTDKVTEYDSIYPMDRLLAKTEHNFEVDPYPVALKKNIIRVYESQIENRDSTITEGLTFKLNYFDDSLLCETPYNNDCPLIGLIQNNQLTEVTEYYEYGKSRRSYRNKKRQYITFFFTHYSNKEAEELIEKLKIQPLIIIKDAKDN